MHVLVLATRTCTHRPRLEEHLHALDIDYEVQFIEDDPHQAHRYSIRHSPALIVDDHVVFNGLPTKDQLRAALVRLGWVPATNPDASNPPG